MDQVPHDCVVEGFAGEVWVMESLDQFARRYGIIIDRAPAPGRWCRYKTEGKGSKRNGAVRDMGGFALVQNWETMEHPAIWSRDGSSIDRAQIERVMKDEAREIARRRKAGAEKAKAMLAAAQDRPHPYLERKGFADWRGKVLDDVLLVPMKVGGRVVNVQRIDADGGKKFLFGAQAAGASFCMGDGMRVWCEGYATALAIMDAAQSQSLRVQVIATFSAGNMANIAGDGVVFADNDASGTGQRAAGTTGLPVIISPNEGEDAADMRLRMGRVRFGLWLKAQLTARRG